MGVDSGLSFAKIKQVILALFDINSINSIANSMDIIQSQIDVGTVLDLTIQQHFNNACQFLGQQDLLEVEMEVAYHIEFLYIEFVVYFYALFHALEKKQFETRGVFLEQQLHDPGMC